MNSKQARFRDLVEPILDEMGRTIWRLVRDEDDAADTLQEAILRLWQNLDRVLTHPNSRALILKICIDCGYDSLRTRIRAANHEFFWEGIENLHGDEGSPSEKLLEKEQEREVLKAISELPKNEAVPLLMRHMDESTYAEISQVLHCSETAARKRLSRARTCLAKKLAHLHPDELKEKS